MKIPLRFQRLPYTHPLPCSYWRLREQARTGRKPGRRKVLGVQKGTEDHGHCAGLWEALGLRPEAAPPFRPPSLDVLKAGLPSHLGWE